MQRCVQRLVYWTSSPTTYPKITAQTHRPPSFSLIPPKLPLVGYSLYQGYISLIAFHAAPPRHQSQFKSHLLRGASPKPMTWSNLFTPLIVQSIFLLCHLQSNCLEPSSSFICLFPVNGYSLEYKTLRAKIISVLSHPSNPRWHPAHSRCSLITGAWMKDWVKNLSVMSSVGSKCEL